MIWLFPNILDCLAIGIAESIILILYLLCQQLCSFRAEKINYIIMIVLPHKSFDHWVIWKFMNSWICADFFLQFFVWLRGSRLFWFFAGSFPSCQTLLYSTMQYVGLWYNPIAVMKKKTRPRYRYRSHDHITTSIPCCTNDLAVASAGFHLNVHTVDTAHLTTIYQTNPFSEPQHPSMDEFYAVKRNIEGRILRS